MQCRWETSVDIEQQHQPLLHLVRVRTFARGGDFHFVDRLLALIEHVNALEKLDSLKPEIASPAREALLIDH